MSSVPLVHPAKAVGRNEMPFVRDTGVVPSNTVLGRSPGPIMEKGDLGAKPPVCSYAAYRQITLALVIVIIIIGRAGKFVTFSPVS